jgi:hypothetical protein
VTADEVLSLARAQDIRLEARGDTLHVEGPKGSLTPALRAELLRHKPALLVRLAPVTAFVRLKGGLVVPTSALLLALDLERRGFRMSLDRDQQVQIEPTAPLTEMDRTAIDRWRLHLGAIVAYDADAQMGPPS